MGALALDFSRYSHDELQLLYKRLSLAEQAQEAARIARDQEQCPKSLATFIKAAWEVLEPSQPYAHGWHIDAMCDHLEAVTKGDITRLLMNVPPGSMKSLLTGVFWPAWEWGPKGMPNMRFIGASHEESLATRDNVKMRRLVESDWFQARWPTILTSDQNAKQYFENIATGWRQSCPVKSMTGKRGDRVLWDDPHSVEDAHSKPALAEAERIFRETLPTRLNNPETSAIVVIMQRLNEKDVSGIILKEQFGYDHLCIPMEYEGKRKTTSIGWLDPRSMPNELMFPARFSRAVVERDKRVMGTYAVAGQFQQRPSPAGGGIISAKEFMLWPAKTPLPDLYFVIQSYDTAFTEKTENDPTACLVLGIGEHVAGERKGEKFAIILDAWTEYLSYPKLRKKVMDDWRAEYGGIDNDITHPPRKPDMIVIEEKGSGQSLLQDLRVANVPVRGYNPGKADKITRAHMVAPLLEAGLIYVLESKRDPGQAVTWARALIEQCIAFPNGEHDDMVDTLTQALIYLRDISLLQLDFVAPELPETTDYHDRKHKRLNPYGN
jgi:predicted phage terminase large subunit-like protein